MTTLLQQIAALTVYLVAFGLLFTLLERAFALRPAKLWRAEIRGDLVYYYLGNVVTKSFLIAIPIAIVARLVHAAVPEAWLGWAAVLPVWARLALAFVVMDLGSYWGHRLTHRSAFLWRFHALHHSVAHMYWLANNRAHPIDLVFVRICGLVPLYVFGLVQAPAAGVDPLTFVLLLAGSFWSFFIHANLRWRFGFLEQLIATPAFHHWHHTKNDHIDRNYAAIFPWIDRLFGTLYLPREWPAEYGIEAPMPQDLAGQLLDPLARPRAVAAQRAA